LFGGVAQAFSLQSPAEQVPSFAVFTVHGPLPQHAPGTHTALQQTSPSFTGHTALSAAELHDALVTHVPLVVSHIVFDAVHWLSVVHGLHSLLVQGFPPHSADERHAPGVHTPLRHSAPAP
jgi:hypothetical protein